MKVTENNKFQGKVINEEDKDSLGYHITVRLLEDIIVL